MSIKANVIIQCRFSSSRLPGKALYPICGIPLVDFLIQRLKSKLFENEYRIILATSTKSSDDPVAAWGEYEGIPVIRGNEEDVLSRYIKVIKEFPCKINVRVTADNPLTCPEILKKSVFKLINENLDYVGISNFPYGSAVDVFTEDLLYLMDKEALPGEDREHINGYVLRNSEFFKIKNLKASGKLARPDFRVTIDTLEDYKNVCAVLENTNLENPWEITLEEALRAYDTIMSKG